MERIMHNGKLMWEDSEGRRQNDANNKPTQFHGWQKTEVEGRIMWESPEGERIDNIGNGENK